MTPEFITAPIGPVGVPAHEVICHIPSRLADRPASSPTVPSPTTVTLVVALTPPATAE